MKMNMGYGKIEYEKRKDKEAEIHNRQCENARNKEWNQIWNILKI